MNRAIGFQTLENVFLAYQPIADRGAVNAPSDPRTNGTKQLYSATRWGRNVLFVNTDSRSYRDIRLKTADAAADDTGPRADNPNRTYLGDTQLAWLKQTLLDAQNNGTTWKFVSVSDPMDQLGPIGGALAGTLTSVNADSGKSYMGGYRAERNDLLKFIADNKITNVVFLSTDDHQNRINELYYSPSGQTNVQSSYVKAPYTFAIVCGPLGATGPDAITDHSFTNIKAIADSLAAAQTAAGIDPIGLRNYPGIHDLVREGDPTAGENPQPVDFYSPDTFNFTVLDVSANGKTLTVSSVGMNATAQNAGIEYANGPQSRTIFSFQIDGLNQTIRFDQLANKTFGDPPFAVSATATSGLPVSFTASGNCVVNGSVVTLTASGTCTITASQAGNSDFSPAPDVSRTFSISRPPLTCHTICFGSPLFFRSSLASGTLPDGLIILPGFNFNNPAPVQSSSNEIDLILRGGTPFGGSLNPIQRFNQEFVAAQLSLLRGSGGPAVTANVLRTGLSCYGLSFAPVILSNGAVLSPDSTVGDLFTQASIVASSRTATNSDRAAIADIFDLLDGPGNRMTSCGIMQ